MAIGGRGLVRAVREAERVVVIASSGREARVYTTTEGQKGHRCTDDQREASVAQLFDKVDPGRLGDHAAVMTALVVHEHEADAELDEQLLSRGQRCPAL